MSENFKIKNVSHADNLLSSLNKARKFQTTPENQTNSSYFTDFTIILNKNTKFQCHGCILAAHSHYFKSMLYGSNIMLEKSSRKCEIVEDYDNFLTDQLLSEVLDWMYTGVIELSCDTILDLTKTAIRFVIPELQMICENYLVRQLNVQNCLGIRRFCREYGVVNQLHNIEGHGIPDNIDDRIMSTSFLTCGLLQQATNYVFENFTKFSKQAPEEYLELELGEIKEILSDDRAHLNEVKCIEFLMIWCINKRKSNSPDTQNNTGLADVFRSCIRVNILETRHILRIWSILKSLVDTESLSDRTTNSEFWAVLSFLRETVEKRSRVGEVIPGNCDVTEGSGDNHENGIVHAKEFVLLIGGLSLWDLEHDTETSSQAAQQLPGVFLDDSDDDNSEFGENVNEPGENGLQNRFQDHNSDTSNNSDADSEAESYTTETEEITPAAAEVERLLTELWRELLMHVEEEQELRSMAVIENGEIISANDLHIHHYPNCLLLDIETQTWNVMKKWPEKQHLRGFSLASCFQSQHVFVTGGYYIGVDGVRVFTNHNWRYNVQKDEWTRLKDMLFNRAYHKTCIIAGEMYVLGGLETSLMANFRDNEASMIHKYDLRTDSWSAVETPKRTDIFKPSQQFCCTSTNSCLYLFGCSESTLNFNIVQVLDISTNIWSEIRTTNAPKRLSMPLATLDTHSNSVYITGDNTTRLHVFNVAENTWSKLPAHCKNTHSGSSLVWLEKQSGLYIIGGHWNVNPTAARIAALNRGNERPPPEWVDTCELFDGKKWEVLGSPPFLWIYHQVIGVNKFVKGSVSDKINDTAVSNL